jgi:hypothetical protein
METCFDTLFGGGKKDFKEMVENLDSCPLNFNQLIMIFNGVNKEVSTEELKISWNIDEETKEFVVYVLHGLKGKTYHSYKQPHLSISKVDSKSVLMMFVAGLVKALERYKKDLTLAKSTAGREVFVRNSGGGFAKVTVESYVMSFEDGTEIINLESFGEGYAYRDIVGVVKK